MQAEDINRAGFVAVIGAPNAGKSTLTNAIVGTKVAIVTHKVQTTGPASGAWRWKATARSSTLAELAQRWRVPEFTETVANFQHARMAVS